MALVLGGAGYIGSHLVALLVEENYEVIVVDNLSNSSGRELKIIENIFGKEILFFNFNFGNKKKLRKLFKDFEIKCVFHLAGFKSVNESVNFPLKYYKNNLSNTINLLSVMEEFKCKNIIFSSSATVYKSSSVPLSEYDELKPINPYGKTKLMIEDILRDLKGWRIIILRYFNPIGSHYSGLIGENTENPNNLVPYIVDVITKKKEFLKIYGNDYNTKDGTGIRDYIHVSDLAEGHLKAYQKIMEGDINEVYNLGTGKGYSVMDVIEMMEKVFEVKIEYKICERREGDVAISMANVEKVKEMGWIAKKSLEEMCFDIRRYLINYKYFN